jgi:hypothetical protein
MSAQPTPSLGTRYCNASTFVLFCVEDGTLGSIIPKQVRKLAWWPIVALVTTREGTASVIK